MTNELRQLLTQVRDRLETPGADQDAYIVSEHLQVIWDEINALVGCDSGCDCHAQDPQTDGKVLVFPTRA